MCCCSLLAWTKTAEDAASGRGAGPGAAHPHCSRTRARPSGRLLAALPGPAGGGWELTASYEGATLGKPLSLSGLHFLSPQMGGL